MKTTVIILCLLSGAIGYMARGVSPAPGMPEEAGKYDHLVIVSEDGAPVEMVFRDLSGQQAVRYPHYAQADAQCGYDARYTEAWTRIAEIDCSEAEEHTH